MRRTIWLAATAAIFLLPAAGRCQQADQKQDASQGQAAPSSTPSQPQTPPAPQQDSLAAAARRAREQKKDAAKPAKVFDNDTIPTQGGVSTVGSTPASSSSDNNASTPSTAGGAGSAGSSEKSWRDKFAGLRKKLDQDQADLDVMQRELGVLNLQQYSDPMKQMQQELTRSDINDKTAAIEAKKKQVEADKQAISDAEDDLRKAGGNSGWAR